MSPKPYPDISLRHYCRAAWTREAEARHRSEPFEAGAPDLEGMCRPCNPTANLLRRCSGLHTIRMWGSGRLRLLRWNPKSKLRIMARESPPSKDRVDNGTPWASPSKMTVCGGKASAQRVPPGKEDRRCLGHKCRSRFCYNHKCQEMRGLLGSSLLVLHVFGLGSPLEIPL